MRLDSFKVQLCLVISFAGSACRLRDTESETKSGPGGAPSQWTCNELKSEYARLRPEAVSALNTFLDSKAKLGAAGNGSFKAKPASTNPATAPAAPSSTNDPAADLKNLIAQGNESVPSFPEPMSGFPMVYENGAGIPGRSAVGCDDAYSKFSLDKSNRILEECRYTVKMLNLLINISAEYNQARDGECRSGKSELQKNQVSTLFPYCVNPCRFGLTACTKCEFTVGRLTSHYICGDEQDARQAVAAHCKNNSCSDSNTKCDNEIFNDIAVGTTANKDSNTRVTIRENIGVKFNIEVSAGAAIKANAGTHIDSSIEARVMLKNNRGAPILTTNGGDTATTYSCAITVASALITDVGFEIGAGFDVVVAKGGQTVSAGRALEAATTYNSQSRDITAAGLTMSDMLDGCKNFAINWGKNDLPALLSRNIVLKTVAAKFLGQNKDMYQQDITSSDTYCKTDKRTTFLFNSIVQYTVTNVWWDLQEGTIGFKYHYDGRWFGYNSPVYSFTETDLGKDRYIALRQAVFNGSASVDQIRDLIASSYDKGGWLKACKTSNY